MKPNKLFLAIYVVAIVMLLGAGFAYARLDNSIILSNQLLYPTSDVSFNSVTAPTVTISTTLSGTGVTNAVTSGFNTAYNATTTKGGALKIGGAATSTRLDVTDGTHGARIIPGTTTTTLEFY